MYMHALLTTFRGVSLGHSTYLDIMDLKERENHICPFKKKRVGARLLNECAVRRIAGDGCWLEEGPRAKGVQRGGKYIFYTQKGRNFQSERLRLYFCAPLCPPLF